MEANAPTPRSHGIEFNRQVAQEFLGRETLRRLAMRQDISRNLIRTNTRRPRTKLPPHPVWQQWCAFK
jgi:hypothetical protein